RRIWALSQSLHGWPDLAENIPGMTHLLVIFKETPEDPDAVFARLLEAWENARSIDRNGKTIEIPVDYGGEYATELPALCNLSGVSDREVVRSRHE
ncbi:carboxyltransferase domain-containing protein, partial [Rhizobium ruizarguesonis]